MAGFQTILMYLCFAALAVTLPACAVLWLHEKGLYPIRDMLLRFRRLPPLAQIFLLAFVIRMIVYGGSKGTTNAPPDGTSGDSTNQTSYVEGGTTNSTGNAEGGTTNGTGYVEGGATNAPPDGTSGGSTNQASHVEGGTTNSTGNAEGGTTNSTGYVEGGTTNASPDGTSGGSTNDPPPMVGLVMMAVMWSGGDLSGEDSGGTALASVALPDAETISSQIV